MEEKNSNLSFCSIPLQIRVGVTGKRDINLTDELKSSIQTALTEEVHKIINPKSKQLKTPLSYKIITPLAEGADRIVAIEAMEVLNAEMEVILPMIKEEYKETFLNDESRVEFEQLLLKASSVESLIKKPLLEQFPGKELPECRHIAYENLGDELISKSDILIALWDGIINNKPGGTGAVVSEARTKNKTIIIISSASPHKIKIERGEDFIKRSFVNIELLNSFEINPVEKKKYIENINKGFSAGAASSIDPANLKIVNDNLHPYYIRSSKIAKHFQAHYKNTGLAVYILSPLAVATIALGIIFHKESTIFFLTEFLLLMGVLLLILLADRRKVNKKWIQNRYLTEQLRCATFFILCGFKPRRIKIPSHLRVAHRPDDWMIKVYDKILERTSNIPVYPEERFPDLLEYIKVHWLQDQIIYHQNKTKDTKRKSKRLEFSGWFVFGLAVIAAASHLLIVHYGFEFRYEWIADFITFIAVTLPAVGAALGAVRTHGEYSRIEKRCENMAVALNELLQDSEEITSMKGLEKWMDKIEDTMLHETQDWLMLMKFVKLEAI
ncbi:MAG: hypothetical protein V1720_22680 [bacterium]